MEKPICRDCKYCKNTGSGRTATRGSFFCEHPDKNYISEYFKAHKIYRMFAFIDFGKPYRDEPKIKTSPRWCPKKKQDNDIHTDGRSKAIHHGEYRNFYKIIAEMPTAYDVDKVVEQVREFYGICNRCSHNKNSIATCATFCDIGEKLEIVKSGGVADE